MFQGPKGYIAKMCEVHLQYGRFTLFSSKFHSNIYSILFECLSVSEYFQSYFDIPFKICQKYRNNKL